MKRENTKNVLLMAKITMMMTIMGITVTFNDLFIMLFIIRLCVGIFGIPLLHFFKGMPFPH